MSSNGDCIFGRTIGCILWQRRRDLYLQLEDVARVTGMGVGRIMDAELSGDDEMAIGLICGALGLDVGELLARATGNLLAHHLPGDGDVVVTEEDKDGFPF